MFRFFFLDEDLICDPVTDGAVFALDPENQRPIERMLLSHLDLHSGTKPEGVEELNDLCFGRPRNRNDRNIAGLEPIQRWHVGDLADVWVRDRETMWACCGPVQRDKHAIFDLLRKVVLEGAGETIGLVPGIAEHVREEAFDDAVAADRGDRGPASFGRELDPSIRFVVQEASLGQSLDGSRNRAGSDAQRFRKLARMRSGTAFRKPVHGFQSLAIGAG